MDDIKSRLEQKNVRLEDFQAINALLISRGFLSRDDGTRHRVLYHVAQRAQAEVEDVLFFVYGATLQHDKTTNHYRLLPFGNHEDGLPDPSDEMEIRRELKGSLVKDFIAALLTLRLLHDEKIGERRIEAGGRVAVRVSHSAWPDDAHDRKLGCAVYPTDRIWKAFEAGIGKKNEFLPGMGFVDHEHGSGRLALSRFPWKEQPNAFSYNVVSGSRFNANGDGHLGIYVSAVTPRPLASRKTSGLKAKAVIQEGGTANEMRKGAKLYMLVSVMKNEGSADAYERLVCILK